MTAVELLSRRGFLTSAGASAGSLILASHISFGRRALAEGAAQVVIDPNVFLRIAPDNAVTLICKHFEMGQGVTTGLATLIAEELETDWSNIRVEFAPADTRLYANNIFHVQATGGSTSISNSWLQMRKVGAAARMMLTSAAAAQWGVPVSSVTAESGVLRHAASGREITFGAVAGAAMRGAVPAYDDILLKDSKQFRLIGSKVTRLDAPAKISGTAQFALDVRRPGMLVAIVKRPDRFGGTVVSFDASDARKLPGVVDVVQVPSGVAVLASDTWAAMRGHDALKIEWDDSRAERRSTGEIFQEYRGLAAQPGVNALRRGNADAALSRAIRTVDAEFTFPYLAHAPMEPLTCVMELRPEGAEIWSGCQLQTVDQLVAARVLGLQPAQVKINTLYAGGSFGRRGNPVGDWVAELASIVKAIGGRAPVQVVWTREGDIRGGYYRPMALHRVRAGVDAAGAICGWRHSLVCKSIFTGTPFEKALVKNGVDHASVEGLTDTLYAIGDMTVDLHNPQTAVPVLWWRAVGHTHTAHVMETMIDDLTRSAGKDALEFRLELLAGQPRQAAVLRLAADKAGWGGAMPAGHGRGLACHHSFGSFIAMVAEVSVMPGEVKVERIVVAVDCGIAVNPDIVVAQIEGSVGFTLSSVFRNQITLANGVVEQGNFDDYEPTRMREMPAVEVHLMTSDAPPTGIGEPGVATIAPAIGNAIMAATGRRLRSLPFDLNPLG